VDKFHAVMAGNGCAAAVAGCHASAVLEAAEHDLDAGAAFVVFDGQRAVLSSRNAGLDALLFKCVPEPFGVIALIGQLPRRFWQVFEQGRRVNVIADLACDIMSR